MADEPMIRLGDEHVPRALVERRLGSILLERIERLEPIERCSPGSRLEYHIVLAGVSYKVTLRVRERGVKA